MAHHIEDRWLWLGLGVFTFFAVKGVAHGLRRIVALTEVHKSPPPIPPNRTEDAIKSSSLATLATCENVEIRKAATKILLDRFIAHPSAYKHLVRDASSRNEECKHAAYIAFSLLEEYGYVAHQYGVPPPTPATPQTHRATRREWLREGPTRLGLDGDIEERDLRRRRREAMVINEGDRPVSQEDVWMRDGEGRLSTEEQARPRTGFESWQALAVPRRVTESSDGRAG
ncbi:uncharacterized protein N0V89_011893 [Didymosphaeria variabile]|uniref:Uncharacterized protein n=1 Tax=Didymosphaeria variabile TaxID=1932322 RepID=A0A9W8XBE3_9PLEO|nr:uncharacterized protein N0V89_011893 [Didymosphaeria variabile]KAJ4345758.1 hypothetical protein N0V89_011893 [Didymosphaeria variabile]